MTLRQCLGLSTLSTSPKMLDSFEVLTSSGVVLWSRSYAPVSARIINGLIREVFIEEKVLPGASVADDASAVSNPPYKKDRYTLKWTTAKDLGLIFVVRAIWFGVVRLGSLADSPLLYP